MYYGAAICAYVIKCNQLHAGMWQVSTVLFLVSCDSFGPLKEHSSGSSDKYSSGASAMALSSYSYAGFNSVSLTALLLASHSHSSSTPSTLQSTVGSSQCHKSTKHINLRIVI